jgi:adenylate cyclase
MLNGMKNPPGIPWRRRWTTRVFLALWGCAAAGGAGGAALAGGASAQIVAFAAAAGAALAAFAAFLIGRRLPSAFRDFSRATQYVMEGRYTHRLPVRGADEVAGLAESFNRMLESLQGRERIRSTMDKVVSREIAEELLKGELRLGGEVRFSSILFADVRGFTALSESMEPQELVAFLNEYLTLMSRVVERHGGVVDKYIGDSVMALFGAPVSRNQDAENSLRTALEMIWCVEEFNYRRSWEGKPPVQVSVGINTGPVVAGNMGSEDRLNYTVVGDAVNLAYRLEGLTRHYDVSCLVSEYTVRECKSKLPFRELDVVRVKGRNAPVRVFELWHQERPPEVVEEILNKFESARRFYLLREWDRAEVLFLQVMELNPGDGPSRLYLSRLREMRIVPPGDSWDGVHTAPTK